MKRWFSSVTINEYSLGVAICAFVVSLFAYAIQEP